MTTHTTPLVVRQLLKGFLAALSLSATSTAFSSDTDYAVFAANDLGMHCADLDYKIFSILPPFNVVHAQVIRIGKVTLASYPC